ncbi:MAG: glycine dehydrogenase (aminomethyl-transferring), partial [Aurantimicrobium sp.]
VAVGSSQRFGVPMGFGGPHAGYMAVRAGLERSMPGRLVGVSLDANGEPAYRLTLQAREQHIRRDKATSNICTAQVLLAVMAGMYAVYHGPEGLKEIATQVHERATALAAILRAGGVTVTHDNFFDTLHVSVPGKAAAIAAAAQAGGFLLNQVDADTLTISVDETTTPGEVEAVAGFFGADAAYQAVASAVPAKLVRTSTYLEHPVFNTHRSETSMMRYLKRLADFDYALDRGMIPLGSCTMKLNAATEMEAVTWPEFGGLHPFAPAEDVAGYVELIAQLEKWLVDLTGYNTVSLQPNAGSQGELAGLLAIRGYHLANGDTQRTVCLIPSSAHGTN